MPKSQLLALIALALAVISVFIPAYPLLAIAVVLLALIYFV